MARRAKPTPKGPDKFYVGQRVTFKFPDDGDGWDRLNGEEAVVIEAQRWAKWDCGNFDNEDADGYFWGWGYTLRLANYGRCVSAGEEHLRPLYDGEKLSTWEKFTKKTGIDVRRLPGLMQTCQPPAAATE